jgi:hypothetical protein
MLSYAREECLMAGLWRVIRPLHEGPSASWMRLYYDLLYELACSAHSVDDAAKIAIDHAHATFRSQFVAVALLDGETWTVLPYRQEGGLAPPLRVAQAAMLGDAGYESSHIVEVRDVELFAERFPRMRPVVERDISSLVAAAFGPRVREGYLIFASGREEHYSDDEFRLMALYALATGIGMQRAGADQV